MVLAPKKIFFVDLAKTLGIILIVFTHLNQNFHFFNALYLTYQKKELFFVLERMAYVAGHVGVSLFIVASGFGLTYSLLNKTNPNWKKWLIKKIIRIYPLFWLSFSAFFSLSIVNSWWRHGYLVFPIGKKELITTLLGVQAYFVYWFLSLILALYLIFPFLYLLLKKRPRLSLVLLFFLSLATGLPLLNHSMEVFRFIFIPHLFEFYSGMFLVFWYQKRLSTKKQSWHGLFSLGLFIAIFIIYYLLKQNYLTVLLVITAGPLLFFTFYSWENPNRNHYWQYLVEKLAKYSFAVFLFHLPLINLHQLLKPSPIFLLFYFPLVGIVSFMGNFIIEKITPRIQKLLLP